MTWHTHRSRTHKQVATQVQIHKETADYLYNDKSRTPYTLYTIFMGLNFREWSYCCITEIIRRSNFHRTQSFPIDNIRGLALVQLFASLLFVKRSQPRIIPREKYPPYSIYIIHNIHLAKTTCAPTHVGILSTPHVPSTCTSFALPHHAYVHLIHHMHPLHLIHHSHHSYTIYMYTWHTSYITYMYTSRMELEEFEAYLVDLALPQGLLD